MPFPYILHRNPSLPVIAQNSWTPEKIYSPDGKLIPLKGLMELCAAIRLLADTDGLGGSLKNAGFYLGKKGE